MRNVHAAVVVVISGLTLAACRPTADFTPKSSGSLGLTSDDRTLFVADSDHDRVTVIDTATDRVLAQVPVGRAPERIFVGPEDRIYVTNRGDRTVMRIDRDRLSVAAVGRVGAEPVGISMASDGRLLVANSASGTLSVLDARTLAAEDEIVLGGTPWAVTALPDGVRAYVTDLVSAQVSVVDLEGGAIDRSVVLEHPEVQECQNAWAPTREPAQPADVVLSPEGDRAYVAHVLSRTGLDGFGNATLSLAVAPSVSTLATGDDALVTAEPTSTVPADIPSPLLVATDDETCLAMGEAMDAPSSLVVDATGDWIYVADHNSEALAIVSARGDRSLGFVDPAHGIADLVRVGARPTGLAVRGDLSAAYVHDAFDYDVAVIERVNGRLSVTRRIRFADSDLDPAVDRGRRLFYSAADPRMTQPELGGVSCSSCHPDGRSDGLSWSLPGATVGPWDAPELGGRNTPALWGVAQTAPYQWDGAVQDLPSYSHMMVSWMGGRGLAAGDARDLVAYMQSVPAPDNPNVDTGAADVLDHGRTVFESTCASCHGGAALTDHEAYEVGGVRVDTPSLRGVFATPPYLHDGSARTLRDAILHAPVHEAAAGLSTGDLEAVEAYVRTF